MVYLRTLGRFELISGTPPSEQVIRAQPKRLALLTYLAVATPARPHRRDTLLGLFWPDLSAEEARRALRQALHAIRRFLEDDILESRPDDSIAVTGDGSWCDAVAFERALDAGRTEQALGLYQGTFLDGVFVADASPEFEQWADLVRGRLRERATRASISLAALARSTEDHAAEVRWAELACRLAPEDEASARHLMGALADSGNRTLALRTYEKFAKRMVDDFGAEPSRETQAFAQTLRAAPVISPADAVPVADTASPSPATKRSPSRLLRRVMWTGLAIGGIAAAYLGANGLPRSSGAFTSADRILITDFRNHTRDSLLAGAVTEALRADFSQSRRARVLTRSQMQAALLRMRQPPGAPLSDAVIREIAEREGVKALVTGDVAALGSGFSVSAELTSVSRGEVLAAVREVASDSTRLLAAVDRVSRRLRRGAGESLWTLRTSLPLEQVTTSSLQALRLYSQALELGDMRGENRAAIPLLQAAVALDSTFAMAYRRLGTYLSEAGEQAGATDAILRAFRHRDRLPELERYATMGSYYLFASAPDSAIVAYRALLEQDPTNTRALNNLGAAYVSLKEFRTAEQYFHLALESDSTFSLLYNHLATDQFNSGEYADAGRTLDIRRAKFPPQQDAEIIGVSLALVREDYAGAESKTRELLATAGSDIERRTSPLRILGLLALIRGRLSEAERSIRSYVEIEARDGTPGEYLDGTILLAFIEAEYRRDPARAVALLEGALARYPLASIAPLDRHHAFLAYTYALAGLPQRARAVLLDFRTVDVSPVAIRGRMGMRDEGGYLRAEGAAELAEHRYKQAVVTLARAVEVSDCAVCALPDLARAYDLVGRPDSAIVVYQRYLQTPWSDWMGADGEFRVPVYRRLAELYDARGDTALAIAGYEKVAALWSNADAELQPQVAAVRNRMIVLRAGRPGH
ncbi:MAG: BTAD domain-containing putative transcriptional regulator [Gemmatimonadota bacterium]